MRACALLVAAIVVRAGCGRWGFGSDESDGGSGSDALVDPDALPGDGAQGDTPTGDAAPSCAGYDICDGFEAPTFAALWSPDSMVTLDTSKAHRGTRSVHVHMPAFSANTGDYQTLNQTQTPMTSTTFWIRAWFWLSALPANGNGMELISAERPSSAGDYLFVFNDATHIYSQFGQDSKITMTTAPLGQWFCVVFKIVRSTGTGGSLDLTGDIATLSLPNTQTDSSTNPMNVVTMGMGFASSNTPSAQPALDLWIDDVIVNDAAVSCTD